MTKGTASYADDGTTVACVSGRKMRDQWQIAQCCDASLSDEGRETW
jgi:hypothetical protein